MTRLLASTALVALLATPTLAQTATDATTAPATTEAPAMTDGTTATTAPAETTTTAPADATTTAPADATTTAPADGMVTTDAAAGTTGFGYTAMAGDMSADNFIGKRLYSAETEVDVSVERTDVDQDWEDIGEIGDLVLSQDGQVKAVLVDIGGFLGIGERTVAVSMEQLRVIRDGDSEDDYFIVFTANREALETAPEFEWMDD